MELALSPTDTGSRAARAAVEVIRDTGAWSALEADWRTLYAASPTAAPPLSWDWTREWWRVYGAACGEGGDAALRIFTVREGGALIGALPLYVGRGGRWPALVRRLQFLGTGEDDSEETCSTYLDLLHLPGAAERCMDALHAALLGPAGGDWDELELRPVAATSPLATWRGAVPGLEIEAERPCCISDLTGGFEAYLGRLGRSTRKEFRQLLRDVDTGEGIELALASDAASTGDFFDQLVRVHQERWTAADRPGCFASPRFLEFNRELALRLVPAGRAVLARLSLGGEPAALQLGFLNGNKFDAYVHAARLEGAGSVRSPGNAVQLCLMRLLAERGVEKYDHMMGPPGSYKDRFTTETRAMVRLRLARPTLRSAVHRLSGAVLRSMKR